jgi:tetratricopeptide (TPR) repeat protein
MRSSLKLVIASLALTVCSKNFAQYADVDPRTLPAQIAAQELVVQTEPGNKDSRAWLKLAVLLQDAGSYRDSENAYRQTIALLRAPDPLTVADVFDHMGTMYVAGGQPSKAEPVERHALAIREHQHDRLGTGVSHMHLAMLLLSENELRSAQAEAQIAVNLLVPGYAHVAGVSSATPEDATPEDATPEDATPEEKMTALIDLALVRCASGAHQAAMPDLQRALQIAHANYPDDSLPVGYINFLLGYASWKSGNPHDADELMTDGVHKLATVIGWGHPAYLQTLRQYRAFLVETKRRDRAQQVLAEIEKLDRSPDSPKDSFTVASGTPSSTQSPPR